MNTVATLAGAIPAQRVRKPSTKEMPWFTGDVAGIAAKLREWAAGQPDGDCLRAVIMIEAIQECVRSAPAKARLTETVLQALWVVRGWDAPLAEPAADWHPPVVDLDPQPVDAEPDAEVCEPDPVAPAASPVVDDATAAAVERGDVATLTARMRASRRDRPDGECVTAVTLIEYVHDQALPAAEKSRLTAVVLAAVRAVRGWSS